MRAGAEAAGSVRASGRIGQEIKLTVWDSRGWVSFGISQQVLKASLNVFVCEITHVSQIINPSFQFNHPDVFASITAEVEPDSAFVPALNGGG